MARTTIDYGIDLGTTNSAIAVANNNKVEIIKNNDNLESTPSAVWIDSKERIYIGEQAKRRNLNKPEEVKLAFKRIMGTKEKLRFPCGKTLSPEELSAEILKSLKQDVFQRKGVLIRSVVITVPASFEYPQIDATKRAADLAGFEQAMIIQEPFAAALAYGFTSNENNKFWLVYDLGGGTFDAALIQLKDGKFDSIEHEGDNFLGGKNLDEKIVQELLLPKICADLKISSPESIISNTTALAKLMAQAERVKIELSQREIANVFLDDFLETNYELDIDLTRNQLAELHKSDIDKTIQKSKLLIERSGVPLNKIEKLILVGGPTLAPYLRERLSSKEFGLDIPLDYSIDPITVVAQGAALYASTILNEIHDETNNETNKVEISFSYSPVGKDFDPIIGGQVNINQLIDAPETYQIEFSRKNTLQKWISPKTPLDKEGRFISILFAEEGVRNEFAIQLYDQRGDIVITNPEIITYMVANTPGNPPATHSLGVALVNNEAVVFIEKGQALPARHLDVLYTIRYLEKGSEIDLINIPLLEGEQKRANRNSKIGNLLIHAKELSCDIPTGSEVEVTITMDENRLLIARAYLPILDEEFEARFDLENEVIEKVSAIDEINKQELRYKNIFERVEHNKSLNKKIESHEINEEIDFIKNQINFIHSEGDGDKKAIIKKLINELKQKIDDVDDEVKLPILIEDAKAEIEICAKVVEEYANEKGEQYYSELRTEIEEAIQEKDLDKLDIKLNELISLRFHLLKSDPGFWHYILEMLSSDKEESTEPFTVQKLIDEAKEHLNNNQLQRVDRLVGRIYGYFPDDEMEKISSGYGSTVMK